MSVLAADLVRGRGVGWAVTGGLSPIASLVVGVVVLDLATYVAHRLLHRVPWLWRVHRVHHADPLVDVTTTLRQHPLESVFRAAFVLVPAIALGLPPEAFVAYRMISALNGLFEHTSVIVWQPLDTALSWVVTTPNMHKVHHATRPVLADSNYGNILSVFDRVFRTFTPTLRGRDVEYGLVGRTSPDAQQLGALLRLPFRADGER